MTSLFLKINWNTNSLIFHNISKVSLFIIKTSDYYWCLDVLTALNVYFQSFPRSRKTSKGGKINFVFFPNFFQLHNDDPLEAIIKRVCYVMITLFWFQFQE